MSSRLTAAFCWNRWLVLVALAFIRPSWVVLIPLWALVTMHPRRVGAWVAIAAGSFLLALVIIAIYSRSVAPFPTGFFFVNAFDLSAGGAAIWQNVLFNVQRTFSIADYERIELLHRVQYWTWLLVASAAIGYSTLAWRRGRTQTGPAPQILIGAQSPASPKTRALLDAER